MAKPGTAALVSAPPEYRPSGSVWVPVLVATLLVDEGCEHGKLRGPKRRLEIKAEYRRLIATGIGTAAACKLLGIDRIPVAGLARRGATALSA